MSVDHLLTCFAIPLTSNWGGLTRPLRFELNDDATNKTKKRVFLSNYGPRQLRPLQPLRHSMRRNRTALAKKFGFIVYHFGIGLEAIYIWW